MAERMQGTNPQNPQNKQDMGAAQKATAGSQAKSTTNGPLQQEQTVAGGKQQQRQDTPEAKGNKEIDPTAAKTKPADRR